MAARKARQYGSKDGDLDMEELVAGVQGLFGRGNTAKAQSRGVSGPAPRITPAVNDGAPTVTRFGTMEGGGRSRGGDFGHSQQSLIKHGMTGVNSPLMKTIRGDVDLKTIDRADAGQFKDQTRISEKKPPARFSGKKSGPGFASNLASIIKQGLTTLSNMRDAGQDISEPLAVFGKTLDDYMAEAGDGSELVSGQLAALDAEGKRMTDRAGVGDAKIQEIYAQLANSMGQEGQNATARYADAAQQVQANTDAASGAIKAARADATAGQSEIAKNLGMTDRAPSDAQVNQAADGAAGLSGVAVNGLSGRSLLDTLGAAQADYFQGNKAASQFRGAEARTGLQRDLQDRLGALSMDRASTLDGARQQALQLAQQRYAADYGQFNDQRSYADSVDDRAYNRGQDRYRLENDYALQQQQIEADKAASQAEFAAESQKANQPATFLQIQQQLAQSMPSTSAAKAVQGMAKFKSQGKGAVQKTLVDILKEEGVTDPKELALAMGYAQEFLNQYKY